MAMLRGDYKGARADVLPPGLAPTLFIASPAFAA